MIMRCKVGTYPKSNNTHLVRHFEGFDVEVEETEVALGEDVVLALRDELVLVVPVHLRGGGHRNWRGIALKPSESKS